MQITLPVSELKSALPGFAKVLPRSAALPVLHHLHLSRSSSGVLKLQATDISSFATYRFTKTEPGEVAEVLVPYEPLLKTVKGCRSTDHITLIQEGSQLILRYPLAGRQVDQPLTLLNVSEWPAVPFVDAIAGMLDGPLKVAIGEALACCSQDITRAAIMGAWLDVTDATSHYVIGTDARHLFAANSFTLALQEPLLLPATKFLTWSGFTDDGNWTLAVQPNPPADSTSWFQLQSDHWTFLTQRQEHTIPNWRQILPPAGSSRIIVRFSEAACAFLAEALPQLPGKDDLNQPLQLNIVAGKLSLTARDRSSAHVTTLPVDDVAITGPDLTVTLNRTFLAKAMKWGLTELELTDELSPLVFSTQGKRLVAMPLRNNSAPVAAATASAEEPTTPNTEPEPQPKEEPMPKATTENSTETTAEPAPVNRLAALTTVTKPTVRTVIEQIDTIRDALKGVTRQFGDVVDALRSLEKEKRVSDREVEQVREKLRDLQSVTL